MIAELILTSATLYFIYLIFYKRPTGLPPGEWGLPIIGYTPNHDEPITKFLMRLRSKYGDIFTVKFGQRIFVFMTDYATIKHAFTRPEFNGRPDFFTLKVFRHFQNKGVVVTDGEIWNTHRRFTLRIMRNFGIGKSSFASVINEQVNNLLEHMRKTEGKPAKLDESLNIAVLNVIMGISTGFKYELNDPVAIKFMKFIKDSFLNSFGALEIFNFHPWMVWLVPNCIKNIFVPYDYIIAENEELLNYLKKIVLEHLKVLDPENPKDFIDMYLIEHNKQIGKPGSIYVDDDYFDLVSLISDLYVAGSETTSSSIRWYCYYMAKYPDIQKKIHAEIDNVVPSDRLPEFEDKKRLPYFEASIYEVMRLVSLNPVGIPHSSLQDTTLNGFQIPKGTVLMAGAEICHRNPKYWKNPDKFYPEHFLNKDGEFVMPTEGFLPFAVGRRQCLGESVAKMNLSLFLSGILKVYEICEPEDRPLSLTSNPLAHHNLNFPLPQELIFKKRYTR